MNVFRISVGLFLEVTIALSHLPGLRILMFLSLILFYDTETEFNKRDCGWVGRASLKEGASYVLIPS